MEINKYDVVQITPEHNWEGCMVVVTEVKSWGIQGYVQIPLQGQAYIRVQHGLYEKIGEAIFVPRSEENPD